MPSLEGIRGAFGAARGPVASLALHSVTQIFCGNAGWQNLFKRAILEKTVTYKWNAAVSAYADLRLVGVYKDSGMAKRATTSITRSSTAVSPPNWLLVNQGDGRLGSRL